MALKDWKKTKQTKHIIRWDNKKNKKYIIAWAEGVFSNDKKLKGMKWKFSESYSNFKTKSQVITHAKKYMGSH